MMKTKILGRLLRLPKTTVDSIHDGYADVHQFLFEVIDEFVNQKEPQPTWKNIVDALRHPLIRESNLAREIEHKYCASSSQDGNSYLTVIVPCTIISPTQFQQGMKSS